MEFEKVKHSLFIWAAVTADDLARAEKAPGGLMVDFYKGRQSMINLFLESMELQEEFKKWSEGHEKNKSY